MQWALKTVMRKSLDPNDRQPQVRGINAPMVSRRDFLAGALTGSSLALWGVPQRAWAGDRYSAHAANLATRNLSRRPSNVQVSHGGIPGRGHFEPSLAVNPRNPR